ncbi:unnamed protein product [Somion occarium]|uniref:Jacalin-type lectin domain-containing protein n=1 Tax=Somion occarium TaxID=3059160 RepID=A0ABP1DFB7_9APHY
MSETITQSALYGSNQGDAFNDITIAGWPSTQNFSKISNIFVRYGEIVDYIKVTYDSKNGAAPVTQEHGGPGGSYQHNIALSASEFVVGVYGEYGHVATDFGATNIQKLQFVIADKTKGSVRIEGPFSTQARVPGKPFNVTGTVLAVAGYVANGTGPNYGTRPYLQSLSFFHPSSGFN